MFPAILVAINKSFLYYSSKREYIVKNIFCGGKE